MVATSRRFIYSACNREKTGVSLCEPSYRSKIIIIFLLILWGFDTFRTRKRKRYDPAIEAADASERHQWRYLRWGFRIIQVVAGVYIVVQLIQVLLR